MKKLAIFLALALSLLCFASCNSGSTPVESNTESQPAQESETTETVNTEIEETTETEETTTESEETTTESEETTTESEETTTETEETTTESEETTTESEETTTEEEESTTEEEETTAEPHKHEFSEPTCQAPATCACGVTVGEKGNHVYVNGICAVCSKEQNNGMGFLPV